MKQGTRQPGLFLGPDHLPVSEALDKKYRADLHGVLAQIPLFKMLGEAELSGIVASSAVEMYNPGEVVCREGAEDHRMLVVLDGFVTMEMTLQNSDAKLEQEHGAGFTVGLLSAIAKRPNTASIVAGTGGCLVAALPAAALGAAQEDPQSSQQHANVHMPPDYGKLHFEPAMQHPPQPPRPPRRARVLHNEDFLSYMLSSFGDPERLARLQMTFQRAGSVNFRLFFATWYTSTQRTRALEALNEKIIMRCAQEVLVTWHQCARRAAIERIDVEIDNLGIVDLSLELSLGSPREASTHALRMQAVLTALRHARAAEREAALRASDQEMAHEEVVLDLRKQLSEMSALLKQTEDKLMRATQEIKSQNDTIGSLCTMYLYKQEELQRLQRMNKKDSESPAEDENGGLPFSHAEVLMSSNSSSSQGHASFSHMVDSNEAKMPPKHHAEVGEHGEEFQVNGDDSEVDKPRSQPVMPHQNWPHPGSFSPGIEKRRSPHHKHRLPDYVHPEKTMEPHAISPFQRPLDPGVLGVKEFFITKLEGVEREHAEIFEGRHSSFSPEAHETGASSQVRSLRKPFVEEDMPAAIRPGQENWESHHPMPMDDWNMRGSPLIGAMSLSSLARQSRGRADHSDHHGTGTPDVSDEDNYLPSQRTSSPRGFAGALDSRRRERLQHESRQRVSNLEKGMGKDTKSSRLRNAKIAEKLEGTEHYDKHLHQMAKQIVQELYAPKRGNNPKRAFR